MPAFAFPRLAAYGLLSTGLASAVVGGAIKTRPNFFAAAVSVGHSSGSLLVLANFVLFLTICVGITFKRVFFGELRPIEYEHMFERLWIFLTESLLALTIFRDDFSIPFALIYGVLVFLKCFHSITADRVDYLDQVPPPGPPLGFHVRIVSVMAILTLSDALLAVYAVESIVMDGVLGMVLFASEFSILLASIAGVWARYTVGVIDLRRAGGRADAPAWEEKSMYLFYVDLAVDLAKLLTYLVFFIVIFLNYGLPIHILRDVYMTLRSFISRAGDLVRYRRATRNMDALYPDATAEELDRLGDHTCIICREEMIAREMAEPATEGPNETPKRLSCGHIFHFHCLRNWLERQQSCPTCRRDVLGPAPHTRRTPAPAPQPPAAAQAAGVAAAAAAAGGGGGGAPEPTEAERTRAAYEEYFSIPAPNGDAPVPLASPQRAEHPRAASAPPAGETEDHRVQRSIWGAPIIPGRFLPPPLGAAPRVNNGNAGANAGAAAPSVPLVGAAGPSRPQRRASPPVSGNVTPAASQAPFVFSSGGSPRRAAAVAAAGPEGGETGTASVEAPADAQEDIVEDDYPDFTDDDVPLREAIARAALRRFGEGTGAGSTPSAVDKGKAPVRAAPVVPAGSASTSEPAFDAPPTHHAFLTPATLPGSAPARPAALPRSPEAARAALDERLHALRDVDQVVWGLVGELSRLRSAWEVEDGAERREEAEAGQQQAERAV